MITRMLGPAIMLFSGCAPLDIAYPRTAFAGFSTASGLTASHPTDDNFTERAVCQQQND